MIDEQSRHLTENKVVVKLNRHFTITKQGRAACDPSAVLARRGGARPSSGLAKPPGAGRRFIDEQS